MDLKQFDRFNEFAESCGSYYLATNCIAKWGRKLSSEYNDYQLPESKLLEWVVTGKCPYQEWELATRQLVYNADNIDNYLEWVDDYEVISAVKQFYRLSVNQHRLICCNDSTFNKSKLSRINILLRMIWYSSNTKEDI